MTKANKSSVVLIKKYSNRRLYNTEISHYITLNDLFQMVGDGIDFEVIDAKTGDDLTRNTLTQIIFEQKAKGYNLLPIQLLRQIISCYMDSKNHILPNYLEAMMQNFCLHQDQLRNLTSITFQPHNNPLKIMQDFARSNVEMIENSFNLLYKSFINDQSNLSKDTIDE